MSKIPPKLTSQQRSFLRALGQQDKLTPRTAPSSPSKTLSELRMLRKATQTPLPVSTLANRRAEEADAWAAARFGSPEGKGSAGQAPGNKWDSFFGTPEGYHDEVRADDQLSHETFNLPRAYEGRNKRNEDILDFMIRASKKTEKKEERRKKAKANVDEVRKRARSAARRATYPYWKRQARQLAEHASALHQHYVTTEHLKGLEQPDIVDGKPARLRIGGRRTKKRRKRVKRRKTRRKHRARRKRSKGRRRRTRRH